LVCHNFCLPLFLFVCFPSFSCISFPSLPCHISALLTFLPISYKVFKWSSYRFNINKPLTIGSSYKCHH
jgi:hypothetical protein